MSIAPNDLDKIVLVCEDNSTCIGNALHAYINMKMWESIKSTKFSPVSICRLIEALAKGSTYSIPEETLSRTAIDAIKTLESKNQILEPNIEYVHIYSSLSTNDKSPVELEIAALETQSLSGDARTEVNNTIKLITKYAASSKKSSVSELKNVICKTLEYVHQNGLNIKTIIYDAIDAANSADTKNTKNKSTHAQQDMKMNRTGLIRGIQLFKERINLEFHQYSPTYSVQELCDRVITNKYHRYN